jgi:hypothetical protein
VRVVVEGPCPGLQCGEYGQSAADPGGVIGDGLKGSRGLAQEDVVNDPLWERASGRSWAGSVKVTR